MATHLSPVPRVSIRFCALTGGLCGQGTVGAGSAWLEPERAWSADRFDAKAIHKLEQGETEPRRTTIHALEETWREQKIEFEDRADGGFRVNIRPSAFKPEQPRNQAAPRGSRVGKTAEVGANAY